VISTVMFEQDIPQPKPVGAVEVEGGRVYLHPGQFAVATSACTITTILGSCVAVGLRDAVAGIGGMNHFLLPRAHVGQASLRFGDVAIPQLIAEVCRLGAEPRRLEAVVVGGACVLDAYRDRPSHVGRQNVRIAMELLGIAGIPVVALEVEGQNGRRVVFHPHTGNLVVKVL